MSLSIPKSDIYNDVKKNTNSSGGSLDCDFSLSSAGEKRSNWIGVSSKRLSIGVEGGVGGLFDLEESLKSKINQY